MGETGGHRQRILIVDDTPSTLTLLEHALRREYALLLARDGQEALDLLAVKETPDLILLDIMMPNLDGFETMARLQADPKFDDIPVIFLTAKNEVKDELRGFELGAVDYIFKPFAIPVVLARVRAQLKLRRQAELLENIAMIDPVTETPNRRNFDGALDREWRRAMRGQLPITLALFDLDQFMAYNNNYGQAAGDICLTLVARALTSTFARPGDLLSRYDNDLFAVILSSTDEEAARRILTSAFNVMERLAIEHAHGPAKGFLTFSCGAATTTPHGDAAPGELLEAAMKLLEKAKASGGDSFETGTV